MPRLFIAIDLPGPQCQALEQIRDYTLQARWTPPEQYHLTMRFIGDVDDNTAMDVQQVLRGIRQRCFILEGEGVGVFPSMRNARILFARVSLSNDLKSLYEHVETSLMKVGVSSETRPFHPHVTLARLKDCSPEEVYSYVKQHEHATIEPFLVQQLHLYASQLTRKGAIHECLQTYQLR